MKTPNIDRVGFNRSQKNIKLSMKLIKSLDFHSTKSIEHQSGESKSELDAQ